MQQVDIYRGASLLVSVKPDGDSAQIGQVMGENSLQLNFTLSFNVEFITGDYCTAFGEVYKVLEVQPVKKESSERFVYNLKLSAEGFDLSRVQFLHYDASNALTETVFSITGTAALFVKHIILNAARIGTFTLGETVVGLEKTISFSANNCLEALQKVAEAFGTEWWLKGNEISIAPKTTDRGVAFRYGQNNGLYDIQRLPSTSSVITALKAQGAEKNLPPGYATARLHLPSTQSADKIGNLSIDVSQQLSGFDYIFSFAPVPAPGVTALTILYRPIGATAWRQDSGPNWSGRTLTLPVPSGYEFKFRAEFGSTHGVETSVVIGPTSSIAFPFSPPNFLLNNMQKYGRVEGTAIFDDIYPTRTGKVTGINATDPFVFTDTTTSFDVSASYIPGTPGKVSFTSGQLAGYTFDIQKYDHTTKEFRIVRNKEERSIEVPSNAIRAQVGDEYVLVDIQLPQAYIDDAEARLLAAANATLAKVSSPQYGYRVTIDPKFIDTYDIDIRLGDKVRLVDADLGVDRKIRIVQLTRNVVNENSYQVELGDEVKAGPLQQLSNSIQTTQSGLSSLSTQVQNSAILNGQVFGPLTFDINSLPVRTSTAGLLPVYIDSVSGELVVVR